MTFFLGHRDPKTEQSLLCLKPFFLRRWQKEIQEHILRQIGTDAIVRIVDAAVVQVAIVVHVPCVVGVVAVRGTKKSKTGKSIIQAMTGETSS